MGLIRSGSLLNDVGQLVGHQPSARSRLGIEASGSKPYPAPLGEGGRAEGPSLLIGGGAGIEFDIAERDPE